MNSFLSFYRLINTLLGRNISTLALLMVVVLNFSGESRAESPYNDFNNPEKSNSFGVGHSGFESLSRPLSLLDFVPTVSAAADNIKITKAAKLELEALDMEKTKSEIYRILKEYDGYVERLDSNDYVDGVICYSLKLRIPRGQHFEGFLKDLNALGDKKKDSYEINDITQEYSNTFVRIKNLKTRRNRLRKILELKTENLDDVLSINRELSRVQVEVNRLISTQLDWDNRIGFSIVDLTIIPKQESVAIDLESVEDYSHPKEEELPKGFLKVDADNPINIAKQNIGIIIFVITCPLVIVFWIRRKFPKKNK
jgi:hypothetical protein